MKWINVKEKMPDEFHGKVIVCNEGGSVYGAWFLSGEFQGLSPLGDKRGQNFEPCRDITHWMDYPEGPEI